MSLILDAFSVFWCRLHGLPICQKLGVTFSLMIVAMAVLFWGGAVYNHRRVPGYEWEDWKLRKD